MVNAIAYSTTLRARGHGGVKKTYCRCAQGQIHRGARTDNDLLATELLKHQAMIVSEKGSHVVVIMNSEGQ